MKGRDKTWTGFKNPLPGVRNELESELVRVDRVYIAVENAQGCCWE